MTRKTTTKNGSTNYSLRALVPIPCSILKTDLDKDSSKLEQKTIEIPMDPDDEESDFIKQKYWVLREPEDPETFAKWHVQVHKLITAKKATTLASQLAAAKALLAGPA